MADAAAKRSRRRTCTGGGGGISALPEHVLHGIFARVGSIKDLFMFAVTCRRWLRRFTDPAFLRDLQGEAHRARLLGVFLQQQRSSPPTFLPGPGSPLSARSLTSFVSDSDDDDGTFNYAKPLAARRGILLLQLAPRRPSCSHLLFALCNPITGERHLLPPLEWSLSCLGGRTDVSTYAIITAADTADSDSPSNLQSSSSSSSSSLSGTQLLITTSYASISFLHLHSYSAATRSWSRRPTEFLNGWFSLVGERSAVVHHGAAHWLCIDGESKHAASGCDDHCLLKLSVEVATSRVSLTKLPIRGGGRPLLCVSGEGKLVVASVYPLHVTVWTQQQAAGAGDDGGEAEAWDPTPSTAFRIPTAVPYFPDEQEDWFNFNRGSMLVMYRNRSSASGGVFILDIEKKVMDKVMDCFFGKPKLTTCVAYEMDLVEFFTLRLGGVLPAGLGTN